MSGWRKNKLLKISALILICLLFILIPGGLGFGCLRLHYANLSLRTEIARLKQDPLFKKQPAETADTAGAEELRALAEKSRLEFLSSISGETFLELSLRGGYPAFLEYLRALSAEPAGEIIRLELKSNAQGLAGKIQLSKL
ncbi:MAG: hypothetical protein LBD99_05880 [Candidatus Margulisbacteria bacterium]|jgi:hypothetical protein|nr:hypothetical protein [Candidatus Margulisiibacteriota bacterium]